MKGREYTLAFNEVNQKNKALLKCLSIFDNDIGGNQVELKKLIDGVFKIFEVNDTKHLKQSLYKCVINKDEEKMDKFCEFINYDFSVDYMQKIYQYYEADRKEKMQDFTPKSIAKLVSKLCGSEKEVIDMCCGSGALSIQKWNDQKDTKFIMYEYDENVIPFLLFNICIRNMNAKVYRKDVLSQEIFEKYNIISTNKYSEVKSW